MVEQLRNAVYESATPAERRGLDDLRQTAHAPEVAGYYAAKGIVSDSGYYEVTNQIYDKVIGDRELVPGHQIGSYAQLVSALNRATEAENWQVALVLDATRKRLDGLISQAREVMRARSPELESALLSMGRITRPINPTVQPFWP